jgi:hypothetical protein
LRGWFASLLNRCGVEPRGFLALTRAMILRDLRGQHYAAATASGSQQLLSPLLLVIGQCLTTSVLTCALLFGRVEVWFFCFVNLTLGMLLLASALVVEFQEVVLDPDDLAVLGHRPVSPRTYAAARFANLLFYFALIYLSMHLFPLIVGMGLRDAGPWYAPAYLLASLAGSLAVTAVVVLLLSTAARAEFARGLRRILSWVQIVAILVIFYGGQMVLRDGTASLQVWGAFPPDWARYLPPTWLAWFVERAAVAPDGAVGLWALALVGVALVSCVAVVIRLSRLYATMRPVETAAPRLRPMAPERVGGLAAWAGRTPEERVGYWLGLAFLRRDGGLAMRCLLAFNLALVALAAGVAVGPFGNPCRDADPARTFLAVLAVFLVPAAAPAVVHNLAYARDSAGGWLLRAAPVADPLALARGALKAVFVWVALPLSVLAGATAAVVWGDPLAGALHAILAAGLTWVMLLASLWLVARAWPFSLSPARGSALAVPPVPTLALGAVLFTLAGAHALLATYPAYWVAVLAALPLAAWWLRGHAAKRLAQLGRPGA